MMNYQMTMQRKKNEGYMIHESEMPLGQLSLTLYTIWPICGHNNDIGHLQMDAESAHTILKPSVNNQ